MAADAHFLANYCFSVDPVLLLLSGHFLLNDLGDVTVHVLDLLLEHFPFFCDFFKGEGLVVNFMINFLYDSSCMAG